MLGVLYCTDQALVVIKITMTAQNKFIKHFRDLQAGESGKVGAAETLAYLNGRKHERRIN